MSISTFVSSLQELVQHELPYGLGETRRFSGAGGIQPYVSYLQDNVLMPELRFSDPGERWRIVARVLQVGVRSLYSLSVRWSTRFLRSSEGFPSGMKACDISKVCLTTMKEACVLGSQRDWVLVKASWWGPFQATEYVRIEVGELIYGGNVLCAYKILSLLECEAAYLGFRLA